MSDKLDLLLEAERRGILPDDKKELLAEARNRGLVPGGPEAAGGTPSTVSPEIKAEATKRQEEDKITAPAIGRLQSSLDYFPYFGAYPQITAAGRHPLAAAQAVAGSLGWGDENAGGEYSKERDIIREQLKQKREEMGWSNLPLDLAVGATALPARAAAAAPQAVNYGRQLWNASKIGGLYGAGYGWNENTGTWGEKAENALEHGLGGMVAAPIFKGGIDLGMGAGRWAMGLPRRLFAGPAERVQRQGEIAQDFRDAGIEPPPAAVTESPTQRRTGAGLSQSFLGTPIAESTRPAIEGVEQGVRREIGAGANVMQPGELGAESQGALRRGLLEHSTPAEELDALPRPDLEAIASGRRPESYPTRFGAQYRLAEAAPVEGAGTAGNLRGNFLGPARMAQPGARQFTPEEVQALGQQWQYARDTLAGGEPESLAAFVTRSGGLRDPGREVRHIAGAANERPGLINERNGTTLDDAALRAWEAGYFPNHTERPTIPEFLDALQRDLRERSVFRGADSRRLEDIRAARDMAEELHSYGAWNGVRTRQDAERALERLRGPAVAAERPTRTTQLLNNLGQEARAAGMLKGWKDGDFSAPEFWGLVNRRFGDEVGGLLRSEYERGVRRQANLQLPGLRDQRTLVRRALQDTDQGDIERVTALRRLHEAMSRDMDRLMTRTGPQGLAAANQYRAVDQGYREFAETTRPVLRRLFGQNVSPDEAARRLFSATQNGSQDVRLLDNYFRVLRSTPGGRLGEADAVRALMAPAMEGGMTGFLRAWGNLSPEARRVMQQAVPGMFDRLDRYARLAQRLSPYEQRGPGGFDLSRPANAGLIGAMIYDLPNALAFSGGAHVLARFMSSPRYLNWMTQAPMQAASRPGLEAHLNRLRAIASEDSEIGQDVHKAINDTFGTQAHAAPGSALNMRPEPVPFASTDRTPESTWRPVQPEYGQRERSYDPLEPDPDHPRALNPPAKFLRAGAEGTPPFEDRPTVGSRGAETNEQVEKRLADTNAKYRAFFDKPAEPPSANAQADADYATALTAGAKDNAKDLASVPLAAAHSLVVKPFQAAQRLLSDEGQYRAGYQYEPAGYEEPGPKSGVADANTAAGGVMRGGSFASRPPASLATAAIRREPAMVKQIVRDRLNGMTRDEIAEKHGVSPATVSRIWAEDMGTRAPPGEARKPFESADIERMNKMLDDGKTYSEVGKSFDISATTVRRALRANNAHTPQTERPERLSEVGRGRQAETQLDSEAMGMEQGARNLEAQIRKLGGNDSAVANAINKKYGSQATAEDVKAGNVWWKVNEKSDISHGTRSLDSDFEGIAHERMGEDRGLWHNPKDELDVRGLPMPGGKQGLVHKATMIGDDAEGVDNKSPLETAKQMYAVGATRDEIWKATNWTRDPDGIWRTEIDDTGAKMKDAAKDVIRKMYYGGREDRHQLEGVSMKLSDVLDHPALFKARPELRDMIVKFKPNNVENHHYKGATGFDQDTFEHAIDINVDAHHGSPTEILATLLHEGQHGEQNEQGMPKARLITPYDNRAREAQAYMTEERWRLNAQQRRARHPSRDYRVPEDSIVWEGAR